MSENLKKKMIKLFNETKSSGQFYNGPVDEINFCSIFMKSGSDKIITWKDNNICMFQYKFEDKESILIIISIPINSAKETITSKNVAERIMEIVKVSEDCFITLDFTTSTEIRPEKFVYLTLVKVIKEDINEG